MHRNVHFGESSMNIIMNVCVLVMSLFLTIVVLGCGSDDDPIEEPSEDSKSTIEESEEQTVEESEEQAVVPRIEGAEEPVVAEIPLWDVPFNELSENQRFAILALGPDDKVIVKNALEDHGLHVRDPAGLHLGEQNVIGHMFNGAVGTIIRGPEIGRRLIWFEIKWEAIGKGRCEINGRNPCVGWSAAVSQNDTRLLDLVWD